MGRELEFIVHSLVELRIQLDELRRRVDENAASGGAADVRGDASRSLPCPRRRRSSRRRGRHANVLTVTPRNDHGGDRARSDRSRAPGN